MKKKFLLFLWFALFCGVVQPAAVPNVGPAKQKSFDEGTIQQRLRKLHGILTGKEETAVDKNQIYFLLIEIAGMWVKDGVKAAIAGIRLIDNVVKERKLGPGLDKAMWTYLSRLPESSQDAFLLTFDLLLNIVNKKYFKNINTLVEDLGCFFATPEELKKMPECNRHCATSKDCLKNISLVMDDVVDPLISFFVRGIRLGDKVVPPFYQQLPALALPQLEPLAKSVSELVRNFGTALHLFSKLLAHEKVVQQLAVDVKK